MQGELACVRRLAPGAIASFGSRLASILSDLRARGTTSAATTATGGAWNIDPELL